MNIKQDINMTRKPADLETKYRLTEINEGLDDVEELKTKTEADSYLSASSTRPVQNKTITAALNNKVDKTKGKGLSTMDYTEEDKIKLEYIEENANNYVLPIATNEVLGGIKVDNKTLYMKNDTASVVIPIGTVFFSVTNTNPSAYFGGTWAAIGSLSLNQAVYAYKKVSEEVTE